MTPSFRRLRMRCIGLIAMGVVLLSGAAAAQGVDSSRIHPVTAPVRDAGILDLATGNWQGKGARLGAGRSTAVYDNTCWWLHPTHFFATEHCEDVYDEGQIPSTSFPGAPAGAEDDNRIDSFQIGYCTAFPTGLVDLKISFWNFNDGGCMGWVPQRAIAPPNYNGATTYIDLAGYGLPGDNSGGGVVACWTVTIDLSNTAAGGFCLLSDGDGSWDGISDQFNWAFQHEMDNSTFGLPSGLLMGAYPWAVARGDCTYDNPCPYGCGTGLGTEDIMWVNVDGTPIGGPPNGSLCPTGLPSGSHCYWFGGWPYPYASFYLQLTSSGPCSGCATPPEVYCGYADPSTSTGCGFDQCSSSSGCAARISTSDMNACPVQDADDYDLIVTGAESGRPSLFFGSLYGRAAFAPFATGTLCCMPPLARTRAQSTGGGAACTGGMEVRLNDPSSCCLLLNRPPGSTVNYQAFVRDPSGVGLDVSDAIEITFQ